MVSKIQGSLNNSNYINKNIRSEGNQNSEQTNNVQKLSDKDLKRLGQKECQTCSSRKYVDQSSDPGVSFKTPTSVSPEASFSMVSMHESQHVQNALGRARTEGREIVYQSVSYTTANCPECGKAYVAGGKTTTASRDKADNNKNFDLGTLLNLLA